MLTRRGIALLNTVVFDEKFYQFLVCRVAPKSATQDSNCNFTEIDKFSLLGHLSDNS